MSRICLSALVACVSYLGLSPAAVAEGPLHRRIDGLVAARADGPVADRTTDAEFLRRITLDLAGRTPTADETRAFLADGSPDKRQQLIGQLLDGPEYPRRMRQLFHILLMERLGDSPEWAAWLEASFAANKPWDRMAREMLDPDADDEETRGAALFYTKRLENYGQNEIDYPGLTRDVGRLFLGVDLQCAQCHDHLQIDDYLQVDFQGLFIVYSNLFLRRDTKVPAVGEKPLAGRLEFVSVFAPDKMATGPRLPFGKETDVAVFEKGEEYAQPPDRTKNFPGIPKFSALSVIGEQLPTAETPLFAKNMVNRLWFIMMGRGLVHPLDLHHSENPPSHPELLDLLATEFTAKGYDIKWLLGELARSETYQRSSLLPQGVDRVPPEQFAVAIERRLSAEQLLASMLRATGEWERVASDAAKLEEFEKKFLAAFANAPRDPEEDFMPTLKAALFLMNDATVLSWLEPQEGNLIDHLVKQSEPAEVAKELYLSILTRPPTEEEAAEIADYLAQHPDDRTKALKHLAWALLSCTEFCTNH